jgi:TolA-binding protein
MKNLLKCFIFIFALIICSSALAALAKETGSKSSSSGDKAEAYAEEVLKKIKDESLTDDEKEKMLDKLKKMIEKADSAINKKRIEIQKIEEDIKPLEAQKDSLNAALDELISYAPRAFKNTNDDGTGDKDKKSKKEKSKKSSK